MICELRPLSDGAVLALGQEPPPQINGKTLVVMDRFTETQ
jgi:hypothetical protein